MSVTRATAADVALLARLRCRLWDGTRAEHAAEVAALIDRPSFAAFIARDGDRAIGFAEATLREYVDGADVGAPVAFLEALWVRTRDRRRGVARALLTAVEAWARTAGCNTLGSDADIDNPDGLGWHAALGFEEVGRTVNFVRAIALPATHGMD